MKNNPIPTAIGAKAEKPHPTPSLQGTGRPKSGLQYQNSYEGNRVSSRVETVSIIASVLQFVDCQAVPQAPSVDVI